jgi:hypothetical protein
MATTENNINSTGATSYPFTFEYLKTTDVKISVNGTATTEFTIPPGTPTTVQFNTGHVPASGAAIRIYRDTNVDNLSATFYAGSAIKSQDLNDNFNQNLYVTQEAKRDAQAAWQSGDETIDSSETWQSDNTKVATTGAIDGRIDTKIDTAIETDVLAGTDLAKTQTGGQVTINHSVTGASSVNNSNGTVIQDLTINANGHITATGSYDLDNRYYNKTDLDGGQLDNRYYRESELLTDGVLDTRYFTQTAADARYFNVSTGDTIKDGDAFPDNDTTIATTAAINDRIVDLVDDVGGFVPIANETSFPSANPDVNNGAGTLVSIKALASNLTSNGSGVASISNGAGSGKTVHITGLANSTTYAATFGMILETTQYSGGGRGGSATDYEYTFHRQVPKATEVTTVATSIANVNNVGGNISNVNTVAGNTTNINTVAANNTNVTTVGTNIANVNTVATNITDVSSFKDLYQISTSAPSTDGGGNSLAAGDMWFDSSSNKTLKVHNGTAFQSVSPSQSVLNDIAIVSGEITFSEDLGSITTALATGTGNNINTVATGIANINTVAGVNANVTTVAGIAANVTTVAGIASNVTAVAGNASNINSAVSNASNINSAVSNASNINSAVSNASNINTVAGSIADVNRYATEYTISNSTPSSPSSGDLWYDGANNVLKFYNNSSFVGITPGLTDVINDSTPELGGHLDCNDKNLTEVGTVSGNNLQMDFGTLT